MEIRTVITIINSKRIVLTGHETKKNRNKLQDLAAGENEKLVFHPHGDRMRKLVHYVAEQMDCRTGRRA
jgi:hypothetical protein